MLYRNLYSHQVHYALLETRPKCSDQDQDQDRHWSETGLVIRPRSQTTTLVTVSIACVWPCCRSVRKSGGLAVIKWSVAAAVLPRKLCVWLPGRKLFAGGLTGGRAPGFRLNPLVTCVKFPSCPPEFLASSRDQNVYFGIV